MDGPRGEREGGGRAVEGGAPVLVQKCLISISVPQCQHSCMDRDYKVWEEDVSMSDDRKSHQARQKGTLRELTHQARYGGGEHMQIKGRENNSVFKEERQEQDVRERSMTTNVKKHWSGIKQVNKAKTAENLKDKNQGNLPGQKLINKQIKRWTLEKKK